MNCSACDSEDMAVGIAHNVRGEPIHPWYCRQCGKVETRYVSKVDIIAWCAENGPLAFIRTATQKRLDAGKVSIDDFGHMTPCEVCGDRGTSEYHHWAPRHLFGDDADKWPTASLCRACHLRWHQTVTPNMSQRKFFSQVLEESGLDDDEPGRRIP